MDYREPAKGWQILLSRTQAGPGRAVKQEQEEISPNHVQAIYGASVLASNPDIRSARLYGQCSLDKMWTLQAGSSVPTTQVDKEVPYTSDILVDIMILTTKVTI